MPDEIIQVVTTTADKQDADTLAQALLAKRLAGCVQISGPIESSYWWNGRIETAREWICTIKTVRSLYPQVEQALLDQHPYDQPEVMALAVTDVSAGYARWLHEQLQPEPLPETTAVEPTASTPESPSGQTPQAPADQPSPAADVTPQQAAEMIPAAGLAAAAQSNVPAAAPFAAGDTTKAGATHAPLHQSPSPEDPEPEPPTGGENAPAAKPAKTAKRAPRKR